MTATGNQTLGRGEIHFSLFKPGTFTPAGFRYIGNTPSFSLSATTQKLEHFNSDRGLKVKDRSITLQATETGALTCDDIQPENMAFYFYGDSGLVAQSSATAQTETFIDVTPGLSYQLGITDGNPTGVRSVTITHIAVGSDTMTAGADYTVDAELGLITVVEGGDIVQDDDIVVLYDRAAKTRSQVISGADQVTGAMRFISYNPEGAKTDFFLPYVTLAPNGSFDLKGDNWQQLTLDVEILKAPNREAIYADGRPYTP
jgi:hypothetical protein